MATHSSTLAWKIPWMEKPGRLQSMGCKESDTTEQFHLTPHSIAQFSLTQKAQNYFREGALVVTLTFTCHQTKELPLCV